VCPYHADAAPCVLAYFSLKSRRTIKRHVMACFRQRNPTKAHFSYGSRTNKTIAASGGVRRGRDVFAHRRWLLTSLSPCCCSHLPAEVCKELKKRFSKDQLKGFIFRPTKAKRDKHVRGQEEEKQKKEDEAA